MKDEISALTVILLVVLTLPLLIYAELANKVKTRRYPTDGGG